MKRQKLATLFLVVGMFLNPLGFDAVQLILIKLTGSLLNANLVLYFLAALCFGFYFYLSGNNPILTIKNIVVDIFNKRLKVKKRNEKIDNILK